MSATLTFIHVYMNNTHFNFGGFTKESWEGNGWKSDENAFLFSIDKGKILEQDGDKCKSIYCHSAMGPTFGGGHDIFIDDSCTSDSISWNAPKSTYDCNDDSVTKHYFTNGTKCFQVNSYEVFSVFN